MVPYSTSAVMAVVWQMYRLLVNLPNFSSCFSRFIKSFIKIFGTSVEYICSEIVSIVGTKLRLPTETLLKGMQRECNCNYITNGWARLTIRCGWASPLLSGLPKQHLITLKLLWNSSLFSLFSRILEEFVNLPLAFTSQGLFVINILFFDHGHGRKPCFSQIRCSKTNHHP